MHIVACRSHILLTSIYKTENTIANKAQFPAIFGGRLNRLFIDCVWPAQGNSDAACIPACERLHMWCLQPLKSWHICSQKTYCSYASGSFVFVSAHGFVTLLANACCPPYGRSAPKFLKEKHVESKSKEQKPRVTTRDL